MVSVARPDPIGACRRVRDDRHRDGWVAQAGRRAPHRPGDRQGARPPGRLCFEAFQAEGGGRAPALGWPLVAAPA